ncbi:hypothetical protein [Paraburkholderia flagellata]|uniref:hypothetical protein n=1 Tax=Paraburkholderia flagellata TaxID=2883241 RepID=UPI001F2760C7|nr:hypothetical protein [Paraburkholderia flagellata]
MNKKLVVCAMSAGVLALAALPAWADTDTRCIQVAAAALKIADHRVHGVSEEHLVETTTQTAAEKHINPITRDFTMRMIQSIYHDEPYRDQPPTLVSEAWLKACDATGYEAMATAR